MLSIVHAPIMSNAVIDTVTFQSVLDARKRINAFVHRTAVVTSSTLDKLSGTRAFFKCENLQRTGSFKARGAHNAVFSLSEDVIKSGVLTHSSGNHAAALSLAAKCRSVPAYIVMPRGAPRSKIDAVERLGGIITFCEPTLASREAVAEQIRLNTGATLIHSYNDSRVIAGQGTAALEFLEDYPRLDVLIAPVGGGGLLSGSAVASRGVSPNISILGAEPLGASDAYQSMAKGELTPSVNPQTIADGLKASLGILAYKILRENHVEIVTVSEEAIVSAMKLVFEILKQVIEPSSAVGVAALLDPASNLKGKQVGVILCGGNLDLERLPWITLK